MIAKFSVKKPYTVLVGVILVIVLGIVAFSRMTTDLLPNMNLPYALVITTDVGASPEEVESDVTAPIEAAMATTSNIKNVSSASYNNYSMVILEYEQDTNMDSVLIEMQQNLDQLAGSFPDTVGTPIIMQLDPDMLPIMVASADVEGMSQSEISAYVENELVPALESVEGIASVSTTGAIEESIQVTMNQEKIDRLNEEIRAKIEEQFTEAQEQLDSSSAEIQNGKNQLESGEAALKDQMSQAQNELVNGKIQMFVTESDLAQNLTVLNAAKGILEKAIPTLQEIYDEGTEIQKQIAKVKTQAETYSQESIKQLEEAIAVLNQYAEKLASAENTLSSGSTQTTESTKTAESTETAGDSQSSESTQTGNSSFDLASLLAGLTLPEGITLPENATLQEAIAQLKNALEQLESNTTSTSYEEQIEALQEQLEKLLERAQSNNGILEQFEIEINGLDELPGIIAQLSTKLAELNTGIAAIQTAQTQIASGKTTMDDAFGALNQTQMGSLLEMSEAAAQLADAENQLALGQQQLDSSKESALEAADLENILTVDMLGNLLTAQNFAMPAGYVGEEDSQYMIRVGEKVESIEELRNLPLLDMGLEGIDTIRLSDVADVELVDNAAESYAKVNGNPAVMLSIEKQTGYSTGEVTDKALDKFKALEAADPELHMTVLMNQGIYIDIIVDSVLENMIVGAILAVIILMIFLKDYKATLVIACSIPLSVVFAIVLMYFSNISLNIISLSGLALGIGMLVDNSIVVIENIYRLRGEGYSVRKAAVEGASRVTGAIVASTLTTVCVFAPIIFTEGITRQLFMDIALTIAFTLAASLLVAMTFVPMMAAGLFKNTKEVKHAFFEKVQNAYGKVLRLALRFKWLVFIAVVILLGLSAYAAFSRGFTFMDMDMETNQITLTVSAKEDETLEFEELARLSDEISDKLSAVEGIDTIGAMIGGGGTSSLMGGGSADSVTMYLLLDENSDVKMAEIIDQVNILTKDMDCLVTADTSASDMSSFMGSGISVQIRGSDIDKLQELTLQVTDIVEQTEGTVNVENGLDDTTPSFTLVVDKEKAAEYGMTTAQIFQLVMEKMASAQSATTVSNDVKSYEVYIQSNEQAEVTLEDIRKLTFSYTDREGNTEEIPVSEVVTFEEGNSMNSINRDAQTRYMNVSAGIDEEHNVTLVSNELQKELEKLELPEGYSVQMTGEDETINETMSQLYLMLLLAVILIYLIMVAQFQSFLSPFIIMFTIPLAFTGGLFALYFTGNEVSVVAMIGFVMLAGIIVNNGIVLVDYINQLRRGGMEKKDAIVEAGKTRLRPILMTALTTILAMSTMAMGMGSGSEMMQPMAIVTEGGLIYGTMLTLIVVPCIYDAFNRNKSM
ncbi:MAG: efflux RND transporter permease subunit, partial [Roseburia sp.]